MPDLIESPHVPRVEFAVSLPHSLLATASLVCAAPEFEGLHSWLLEARQQMAPELLAEICLLITFPGRYNRFTGEVAARLPAASTRFGFEGLLQHLRSIPGAEYQQMALRALARGGQGVSRWEDVLALTGNREAWRAYLREVESEASLERVAELVRDGEALKGRLLTALERFWHEHYGEEYAATLPLMERCDAYHKAQAHPASFREVFAAVTGRVVPEQIAELVMGEERARAEALTTRNRGGGEGERAEAFSTGGVVERVTFVPSMYVGPYVAFTHWNRELLLFYNCRTALPSGLGEAVAGIAGLYPPLRALADETRLQILHMLRRREMYAQEIVDRLEISQPAVSRHLNLMAAAGIVRMRREGNAKFYSIDGDTLHRLADALRGLE